MNYQHTESLVVQSYQQLKTANPNVSLAPNGSELLLGFWHVIASTPQPTFDGYTHGLRELAPVGFVQTWEVYPLDPGVVQAYVASAKKAKYGESEVHAQDLIDEANTYPYQGKATTPSKNKRKVSNRINHASNGKPKGGVDKDRDDVLADYSDTVMDAQDNMDDLTEGMSDATAIYALDVATAVTWPVWTSPA